MDLRFSRLHGQVRSEISFARMDVINKYGFERFVAILIATLVTGAPCFCLGQTTSRPNQPRRYPVQTVAYTFPNDITDIDAVLINAQQRQPPVAHPRRQTPDPFAALGIDEDLFVGPASLPHQRYRRPANQSKPFVAQRNMSPRPMPPHNVSPNLASPRLASPLPARPQSVSPRPMRVARQELPVPENQRPVLLPTPRNTAITNNYPASQRNQLPTPTPARPASFPRPAQEGTIGASSNYTLAGQPKFGEQFLHKHPQTGPGVETLSSNPFDFPADPIDYTMPYDPGSEMEVYQGKTLNANQRPLVEIGRPWYQLGQLSPAFNFLGPKNPVVPQFIVHGDFRTAVSSATQNGDNQSFWSFEANLFFDFKFTSTERIVFNMTPFDDGVNNSKYLLDRNFDFDNRLNGNVNFGYLEGDLGALWGGLVGENLPFDAPFAAGLMPLLFQNGVWLEDAFLGVAYTIPARNSRLLDISNMDITFFYAWDDVTSPAFPDDDVDLFGIATFIEAAGGYFEIDYAFLEDQNQIRDLSYHNISLAYSRRYGRFISNSVRVIANAGQKSPNQRQTADGVLLLIENSFTTANPLTFVPYFNMFAGFDRPQSAARAGFAGGVLRNTGILFETDGMTGFPTLDDTGNDTYGCAVGFNILATDFSQQLILEAAYIGVHGDDANRNARGDQYGLGFRYQLPISNADIIRVDGMIGFFDLDNDVNGIRVEYRHKW